MVFQTEQEKKEFLEQVNFYKENLMKGNKNLSEEEAILKARQAISSLNITYILADVCNSFLMETEAVLKEMGMALCGEDKHRFLLFQKAVKSARCGAGAFSRPLYYMKDSDDAASCSDWYLNFLKLVETKITNAQKTRMLLEFLLTMPNESGVYDVKLEDFEN